jgi:hypothetical protein
VRIFFRGALGRAQSVPGHVFRLHCRSLVYHHGCTTHVWRCSRRCDRECRARSGWCRRPSNLSVPSYRPLQRGGGTGGVRQVVSGSGEGPHTFPGHDYRRIDRRRRRGPITGPGLRATEPLCSGACADAVRSSAHPMSGSAPERPVRRSAPLLRSPTHEGTCAYRTPWRVYACQRPLAPIDAPPWFRLGLCHGAFPRGRDIAGPRECAATTTQRRRSRPT